MVFISLHGAQELAQKIIKTGISCFSANEISALIVVRLVPYHFPYRNVLSFSGVSCIPVKSFEATLF